MTTEEAFDLYHQAVFSFVYRLTRRADLAEDITQDCFLAYVGAPERFDTERGASLKTYLIATARNMAFNWIRDHRCEWQAHKLEATTPPESGMTSEICAAVQSAIAGLPPLQQEALILFEYEGFMLDEIAVMAGVDAGTIKSRLHRARERLRRVLARFKNTENSMEERERPELTNPELDALLQEWRTPVAPPRLRLAVFPRRSVPWYGRWLTSISIPVPVVAILCVLLVLLGWQWGARRERARAETAYGGVASTAPAVTFQGFSPVAELRPRIIRSHHAPN